MNYSLNAMSFVRFHEKVVQVYISFETASISHYIANLLKKNILMVQSNESMNINELMN